MPNLEHQAYLEYLESFCIWLFVLISIFWRQFCYPKSTLLFSKWLLTQVGFLYSNLKCLMLSMGL